MGAVLSAVLLVGGLWAGVGVADAQVGMDESDRFYSGVIDGPEFCLNRSFGGPVTYPFDSDGDGVAETCSLPRTRRAAAARQNALEQLGEEQPERLGELFIQQCAVVPATFGNPDKEAVDECATGVLGSSPSVPDDSNFRFYSGVIDGPEFCLNRSFGGPVTYPFDSDGDGVAETCSLPRTRRAAAARQNALGQLGEEQPERLRELFAAQCLLVPATFGNPEKEAIDECAAPIERAVGEQLAALVLAGANERREGLPSLALDAGLSEAAYTRAAAQGEASDWLTGYDYGPLIGPDWGTWRDAGSVYLWTTINSTGLADRLSNNLLNLDWDALRCAVCTHIGVGIAEGGERVYATAVVAAPPFTEAEIAAAESHMAGLVNQLRLDLGLGELAYHDDIAAVARNWSQTLSTEGQPFEHNPDYSEQYPPGWRRVGENIAQVWVYNTLAEATQWSFDNLVDSPGHYANMTKSDFTHIGVGIATRGSQVWVTQNFAAYP